MCKDHSGVLVEIPTASVTFSDQTARPNGNKRGVDACIAPIVKALNDAAIGTVASCCGHGTHVGSIALTDGRELLLVPDFQTARHHDGPLRKDQS